MIPRFVSQVTVSCPELKCGSDTISEFLFGAVEKEKRGSLILVSVVDI